MFLKRTESQYQKLIERNYYSALDVGFRMMSPAVEKTTPGSAGALARGTPRGRQGGHRGDGWRRDVNFSLCERSKGTQLTPKPQKCQIDLSSSGPQVDAGTGSRYDKDCGVAIPESEWFGNHFSFLLK